MNNYENKLNPLPIALSILYDLTSDEFLKVISQAGIQIDMILTKEENYSNKTRMRVYIPRVSTFLTSLNESQLLKVIYLIFNTLIIKEPNQKDTIKEKLNLIGWDIENDIISPIDSTVIEAFFEKGLVHSAYQKIRDIVHSSTTSIYIADPYIDKTIFEFFKIFSDKQMEIKVLTLNLSGDYSHEKTLFNSQYQNLIISEKSTRDFHDRFIIVDESEVYHIGASIKDAGKKVFMINKVEDEDNISNIISSFNERFNQ